MNNKEEFKEFVRKNPKLIKFVKNGEMSWQKFYEIYNLYGEDDSAWNDFLKEEKPKNNNVSSLDFIGWLKTLDLDSIQNGVASIQRVLGVVQDLAVKDNDTKQDYTPRPIYKHFED